MKKATIVIMATVFMALFLIVELVGNQIMIDPICSEVYSVARAEGYNYAGVRHLSKKDDGSKLDELLDEVTKDIEHDEGDDHIWISFLDNSFEDDGVSLMRVTRGMANLGKPEKAYVFALIIDD